MVWLAKWIRELRNVDGRVLIVTDRTELDEQIEMVFKGVDEDIYRTKSGADLAKALRDPAKSLICSLVHKFGSSEEGNIDQYVSDLRSHISGGLHPPGEIFVFVDECHRTQSGKLHRAMKAILPDATLIGFTGTPLLRADKQLSIEIFGPYIHTYKYDEAVDDGVVLDLCYEARDIDQDITSESKIDQWFDIKTKGLSDLARAQLRQRWGTMRKVTSSLDRIRKIVDDILIDMETRDRLKSGRGNAMLVSDSVYAACRFFEAFRETELKDRCAIVTSYSPAAGDIKGEETGEGLTEKLLKYDVYRKMLADHFDEPADKAMHRTEQFEQEVKRRFVNEPGQMKLLIVVDKLLTGFDAPPATYLYIDKRMQDHGLFQAICRVNRLDGDDKEYGYIIDYKDLFKSLEGAIQDYTGEAFDGYDREDVKGLLKDRLEQGRKRLEETREAVKALCEPVEPPYDSDAYRHYFCHGGKGLAANERKRLALYRAVAAFLRAYANLANEMIEAGYTEAERQTIRDEVGHYEKVRQEIKLASGDYVDLKVFEPAMRHLLDNYIRAEDSEVISKFDDMTLVELLISPRSSDASPRHRSSSSTTGGLASLSGQGRRDLLGSPRRPPTARHATRHPSPCRALVPCRRRPLIMSLVTWTHPPSPPCLVCRSPLRGTRVPCPLECRVRMQLRISEKSFRHTSLLGTGNLGQGRRDIPTEYGDVDAVDSRSEQGCNAPRAPTCCVWQR